MRSTTRETQQFQPQNNAPIGYLTLGQSGLTNIKAAAKRINLRDMLTDHQDMAVFAIKMLQRILHATLMTIASPSQSPETVRRTFGRSSSLTNRSETLESFRSRAERAIFDPHLCEILTSYLNNVLDITNCAPPVVFLALKYVQFVCNAQPRLLIQSLDLTSTSATASSSSSGSAAQHRNAHFDSFVSTILTTCLILSNTYLDDNAYHLMTWSKVIVTTTPMLIQNQRAVLQALKFRLLVRTDDYFSWINTMGEHCWSMIMRNDVRFKFCEAILKPPILAPSLMPVKRKREPLKMQARVAAHCRSTSYHDEVDDYVQVHDDDRELRMDAALSDAVVKVHRRAWTDERDLDISKRKSVGAI